MCRWLAYSGAPILLKDVLYEGPNSLVGQSLHSRMGAEPTNGDGFGVGWYGAPATPGVFHSTEPAWNDQNLLPHPFQGTIATSDGESIWAFRYSSERNSRTLYYTTDVPTLRQLYPEREQLRDFSENARLIVSEPLGDVAGVWNAVPESSCGIVRSDHAEMRAFRPRAPVLSVAV